MDGIMEQNGFSGFLSVLILASVVHTANSSAAEPGGFPQFGGNTISTHQNPSMLSVTQRTSRESRCYATARLMGVFGGRLMGVMTLYFNAASIDGAEGSFGEQLLGNVSSIALGSYAGLKMSNWMAHQVMRGEPKPLRAGFRGALCGFIAGSATVTASLAPLLIMGKAFGTSEFNRKNYSELCSGVAGCYPPSASPYSPS